MAELGALIAELADERTRTLMVDQDPIVYGVCLGYLEGDVFMLDDAGNILNLPSDEERTVAVSEARAWVASGKSLVDLLMPSIGLAQAA